jgi:hypothetical protein
MLTTCIIVLGALAAAAIAALSIAVTVLTGQLVATNRILLDAALAADPISRSAIVHKHLAPPRPPPPKPDPIKVEGVSFHETIE